MMRPPLFLFPLILLFVFFLFLLFFFSSSLVPPWVGGFRRWLLALSETEVDRDRTAEGREWNKSGVVS